jgi:hypothetical protein
MKHFIRICIFTVLFVIPSVGQDKEAEVVLPDSVMQDVLRQIAANVIKPAKGERLIYVANQGLGTDWLPEIKNVDFVLLDNDHVHGYRHPVYFWKDLREEKGSYLIDFGRGDVCSASGGTWSFGVVDSKVEDLHPVGGWGSAC